MTAGEEDDTIADKVTRAPAGRHTLPIALTDEGGDITYKLASQIVNAFSAIKAAVDAGRAS